MALVGQTIGREISKLERRHEKRNGDKDGQRASSYRFVSSFGVISLHSLHSVTKICIAVLFDVSVLYLVTV